MLAAWDGAVTSILVVGFSLLLSNTMLNYVPQSGKIWYAIGFSIALSWICQWGVGQALIQISPEDKVYVEFLYQSMPVRWVVDFLVIAGVSVSSLFYNQLREQEEIAQRQATTATMVKDAELRKLQLQLQPHFLFNCLNSINALILVRPDEGRKMVQNLSDFLRVTIKRADEQWISFRDEWDYIESYLEIEKIRFGHRLDVQLNLEKESYTWKMPTLLLQPLIENAIKFCLYGTTEKVTIKVESTLENQLLKIIITNPFDRDMQPQKGSGFGLNGMQRRLYLLFARNDLLETSIHENIFTVIIKLPMYYDQSTTH
jgi:LytS/YehU family sensor histidine kinase